MTLWHVRRVVSSKRRVYCVGSPASFVTLHPTGECLPGVDAGHGSTPAPLTTIHAAYMGPGSAGHAANWGCTVRLLVHVTALVWLVGLRV